MKLGHIILKVKDLDRAVQEYKEKGFTVEYGRKKNPINALIYFSNGPYIELLAETGMPTVVKILMRIFGKGTIIDRIQYLDNCDLGYCELVLENYENDLNKERTILQKYGIKSSQIQSHRVDTYGRDLRFKIAVPSVLNVPFLMTYFSIDPKPTKFTHPNGITEVKKVIYATDPSRFSLIKELCDDERLELREGSGIEVELK